MALELAPGERIIVIAGSYGQAERWMREHGVRRYQAVIVSVGQPWRLRGLARGTRYVSVGTYGARQDLPEIMAALCYLQARPV